MDIEELLEYKIEFLPLFFRYIKFREQDNYRIKAIKVKSNNTSQYFIHPFYRPIQPLKLEENDDK